MLALQPFDPLVLPGIQILGRKPVILLLHVHPPPFLSDPQLLLLAHLPDLPVMFLVPQGSGGGEEKRACQDGCDEGEAEEEEGVVVQGGAVAGGEGVGV